MGAKDSRPSFISYEDAVKRVSDNELRRIREAFKRCAGVNGTLISRESFFHDVLCDVVPPEPAEWLYQACGGTKRGLGFKDLLCGIVVLTKGSEDEKIKFLWTLYTNKQNDNGMYLNKWDFAHTVYLENLSLEYFEPRQALEVNCQTKLFGNGDRVTYEQFRSWLLIHKNATVMSEWLLSDLNGNSMMDTETPTFYQSLAGVTHLEEKDIIDLEKCFWSLRNSTATGQLDQESVTALVSPPLPPGAVTGFFLAFDENRDGHIDFKELCCGLSAACRGPKTERLKFCFKIFDQDRDSYLNKRELSHMVTILTQVANESLRQQASRSSTPDCSDSAQDTTLKTYEPEILLLELKDKLSEIPKNKPIFHLGPLDGGLVEDTSTTLEDDGIPNYDLEDGVVLTLEDFLIWAVESSESVVTPFLDLIFEICHIVLGLRPQCKHQERDVVLGWIRRETVRGYQVGQFWYLVCMEWWGAWGAWTASPASCCRRATRSDSFTSDSTESMGSLLWRAESASLGSGSSSGVSSSRGPRPATSAHPLPPGPINNDRLLDKDATLVGVPRLTGEGGCLRRDVTLAQHRDFCLLPPGAWRALLAWYGGAAPLPRQVIRPPDSDVELELYPIQLKILRHVTNQSGNPGGGAVPPARQLAYTAAFSRLATISQIIEFVCTALNLPRDGVRLWCVSPPPAVLLDDERRRLQSLSLHTVLLERRLPDLTWPEDKPLTSATGSGLVSARRNTLLPAPAGAAGLHNLGNTCFMNAALQAVWHTAALKQYFVEGRHLSELQRDNPLGTRAQLALCYAELCKEVWTSGANSVAPVAVRACVGRLARALAGGGQHDAQELLAWLLDTLHEELNARTRRPDRVLADTATEPNQPLGELKGAMEAWEQFTSRNHSIISELFYGMLKSRVRCVTCSRESTTFETFNMLSVPLPLECHVTFHVTVTKLDGSVPIKYGVRVNSDGFCRDVKAKLAELSGLPAETLLLCEVSNSMISKVFESSHRVKSNAGRGPFPLWAYEIPAPCAQEDTYDNSSMESSSLAGSEESWVGGTGGPSDTGDWVPGPGPGPGPDAEPGRTAAGERSRSEIVRASSGRNERFHTLPRNGPDLRREVLRNSGSPALSVRSLNVTCGQYARRAPRPPHSPHSPRHSYLVAVHRKQCRSDTTFLPLGSSRQVFGTPLVVGAGLAGSGAGGAGAGAALYGRVWRAARRLLTSTPPHGPPNHAHDCDDSLGYEFPFKLRVIVPSGRCARCAWPRACVGCVLRPATNDGSMGEPETDEDEMAPLPTDNGEHKTTGPSPESTGSRYVTLDEVIGNRELMLAVDWEPTALHLRYQANREKEVIEHETVAESTAEATRPVDIQSCLRAFTQEERLDELYHCENCNSHRPAEKKIQIWRLPPILVIHLKRFQCINNNKWVKSQKVVHFPYDDFDPTPFLAAVPQETVLRYQELNQRDTDSEPEEEKQRSNSVVSRIIERRKREKGKRRQRLESTSLATTPVTDDNLIDFHGHNLLSDQDPFDIKYRLYAVVCHSGGLNGGHYVSYARAGAGTGAGGGGAGAGGGTEGEGGGWTHYNDSMRRRAAPALGPAEPYLLFYERRGLNHSSYLPQWSNTTDGASGASVATAATHATAGLGPDAQHCTLA